MPLQTAYRLHLQAVFLPVDYETYLAESRKVKRILRDISPLMEDVGIDEAFLDISEICQPALEIIWEIKTKNREEAGLTCSIGIGPNKLLAKIASDMEKPDGYTLIRQEDIERVLWPLPVRKLWGVGPKTETSLKNMGIERIGELAELTLDTLVVTFGKSYGSFLCEASHGIDEAPLVTPTGRPGP
jgi:DNA polymerase IV